MSNVMRNVTCVVRKFVRSDVVCEVTDSSIFEMLPRSQNTRHTTVLKAALVVGTRKAPSARPWSTDGSSSRRRLRCPNRAGSASTVGARPSTGPSGGVALITVTAQSEPGGTIGGQKKALTIADVITVLVAWGLHLAGSEGGE